MNKSTKARKSQFKTVNLALQGGGAHGAFAWGVLDQICEDGRLSIDGLSATSAGAMNTTVYAYGMMKHGPDGARQALHDFWKDVSEAGQRYSPVKPGYWDQYFGGWENLNQSFAYHWFDTFTKLFSPYQFNPLEYKGEGGPPGKSWAGCEQCWPGCNSYTNDASLLLPSTALTGRRRPTVRR